MHQRHTQPLSHAHQGILGVVAEFVEQLKSFANRSNVCEAVLHFLGHVLCLVPIEQRRCRLQVARSKVGHQGVPCRVAVTRRTPSTEQGVCGASHGGKHDEFGHLFSRLQDVGHLRHG